MEQVEDVILEDTPEVTVEENKTETKIAVSHNAAAGSGCTESKIEAE